MSEALTCVVAIIAALAITTPFALLLNESRKAKEAEMSYFVRRSLDMPPPPPRPQHFADPAAYFEAAAAWNKSFEAYCAKYPA